jgi:hypothetical protein
MRLRNDVTIVAVPGGSSSCRALALALALVLTPSLPANAAAAAHHRCPPRSEWVKAHLNPVGHWINGHCFITRPLSVPRNLSP